jgi:hypothetical protein
MPSPEDTMKGSLLLTTLVALALPLLASAQDRASTPPPGSHAVTFSLPDGGGAGFGVRRVLGSGANAGLELLIGVSRSSTDTPTGELTSSNYQVGLAPDIRLYRGSSAPVVPFVELSGEIRYLKSDDDDWVLRGVAGAGLGVEWFPLPSISVSGSTGLRLDLARADGATTSNTLQLGAGRSALRLNLYF